MTVRSAEVLLLFPSHNSPIYVRTCSTKAGGDGSRVILAFYSCEMDKLWWCALFKMCPFKRWELESDQLVEH